MPVLYAAGSNSHNQLSSTFAHSNFRTFDRISTSDSACKSVLHASWSTTTILSSSRLTSLGFQLFSIPLLPDSTGLHSAIGDHNGLIGCLNGAGQVCLLQVDKDDSSIRTPPLASLSDGGPTIAHIALAGNGRVAVAFKQSPASHLAHVVMFDSIEMFKEWYVEPTINAPGIEDHHELPGRVHQLSAGTATLALLMESGDVWTWGEGRYATLARAGPAGKPGKVEALGGVKVVKMASGGWLSAALSEDKALYVWGSNLPGEDNELKCLEDIESSQVALVEILVEGEIADILDVAVGDNHIVAVTAGGRLFMAGDNLNGQCGVGSNEAFLASWTEVPGLGEVKSVWCGPKASFAMLV